MLANATEDVLQSRIYPVADATPRLGLDPAVFRLASSMSHNSYTIKQPRFDVLSISWASWKSESCLVTILGQAWPPGGDGGITFDAVHFQDWPRRTS